MPCFVGKKYEKRHFLKKRKKKTHFYTPPLKSVSRNRGGVYFPLFYKILLLLKKIYIIYNTIN